jgi:hypothetical protein
MSLSATGTYWQRQVERKIPKKENHQTRYAFTVNILTSLSRFHQPSSRFSCRTAWLYISFCCKKIHLILALKAGTCMEIERSTCQIFIQTVNYTVSWLSCYHAQASFSSRCFDACVRSECYISSFDLSIIGLNITYTVMACHEPYVKSVAAAANALCYSIFLRILSTKDFWRFFSIGTLLRSIRLLLRSPHPVEPLYTASLSYFSS